MDLPAKTFTHDCESCVYLGNHTEGGSLYDLYHCGQGNWNPTVIARWGNEGYQYLSGLGMNHTGPLVEAMNRAKAKGLPTEYDFKKK